MKTIIDGNSLARRARIAHTASLGGLLVLLGSVAISLWKPNLQVLSSIMLFGGFAVAVLGIAYANRWVKKPRPEFILDQSLKGLSDQHRMYHYTPLGDHILLTPNGVVVLETVNLEGQFTYLDGKWKQKMSIGRALRYIVEEKLGNPTAEAQTQVQSMENYLQEKLPGETKVPVQALVVFSHPLASVKVDKSPLPVVQPEKLAKKVPHPGSKLPPEVYQQAREALDRLVPVSE
jgi:Nuclease-related domain